MKRKIVLTAALCLAAALSIGAAPALAADGCDCHTSATPSATPAHAPLVAIVSDCTTCHVGMTVVDDSHPDLLVKPALTASLKQFEFFTALTGGLSIPWVPLAGVTIYPQMKVPAATDWTTLEPPFGADRVATNAAGDWFRMVGLGPMGPPEGATFRAISQGFAGPPVVLPALSGPFKRPFPTLTLRLRGLKHGVAKRGHAVTARGKALPAELAGRKAFLRLQRSYPWPGGPHRVWRTVLKATRTIGTAGDFSKRFTPKARGQYRIRAFVDGTAAYRGVTTDWRRFRVR